MKSTNRKSGITLTQKQWASLSLTLFLALVAAVLVLPPWSPVSLTAPGTAGPNPEAGQPAPQPTGTRVDPVPSPDLAGESPGVAPASTATSTPQAAPAATATATPKAAPTTLPARTPLPSPTATPRPAESSVPQPAPTAAPSSGAGPEGTPEASPGAADASVEELILATEDPDWGVRWDAVDALGVLKDPRGVPALVKRALYDDNPHPRWRSLWALSAVDSEEAFPLLRTALEDSDQEVVRNAAIALAFLGQPEGLPVLLQGLKDPVPSHRWDAVFSLSDFADPEVVAALIPLLNPEVETDTGVRQETALTLGRIGGEEVVLPLLDTLKNDPRPEVRWRAALSLSGLGDPSVIAELEQALSSEEDGQVRESLEEAISALRTR